MSRPLWEMYNPEFSDRMLVEKRGVSTEQNRREFADMWAKLDALYHSPNGVMTPNGPDLIAPEFQKA